MLMLIYKWLIYFYCEYTSILNIVVICQNYLTKK